MQPPEGTTQARFVFPQPPFELKGPLTVPFDFEQPKAKKKKAPATDKKAR